MMGMMGMMLKIWDHSSSFKEFCMYTRYTHVYIYTLPFGCVKMLGTPLPVCQMSIIFGGAFGPLGPTCFEFRRKEWE